MTEPGHKISRGQRSSFFVAFDIGQKRQHTTSSLRKLHQLEILTAMAQRIHLLNVLLFVGVILVACNLLWGDSPVTENLSPEVGEENETRPNLSQLVAKDEVPVVKKKMSSETKSFPSKEKQVRPHILGSGEHSPDSFNSRVDWDAILCPSQGSEMDSCDLKDPKWGVPVILMSHGRSGSGVTWDTLASLATSANPNPDAIWQPAQERTGGSAKSNLAQLNEHPDEHGKCWLETIMCRQQFQNRENFDDGKQSLVYGTKVRKVRIIELFSSNQVLICYLHAFALILINSGSPKGMSWNIRVPSRH